MRFGPEVSVLAHLLLPPTFTSLPGSSPVRTTLAPLAGVLPPQVIAVEGNSLLLGGADIVDGSPVLDIKVSQAKAQRPL